METFRNIGIIGRVGDDRAVEAVHRLVQLLSARNLTVILEDETARIMPGHQLQVATRKLIGEMCDLVIVVGGDGSILSAARVLCRQDVPILGINRGRLGFLTDISPSHLEQKVAEILEGHYTIESRFLLDAIVSRDGDPIGRGDAVNDVVITAGASPKMVEFELYMDGQFVYTLRSDGLIVSTPTGSTAYSLSGGGPIMHPHLDAIALVPMFPHTLSSRPIVVHGNTEIKIVLVDENPDNLLISCDGQTHLNAAPGDAVYIHKKSHRMKLVHPLDHSYYAVCRDKLGWSSRPGEA